MGLIGTDIGIDLGTSTIRIYVKGKGLIVEEPAAAIISKSGRKHRTKLVFIGKQAVENKNRLEAGQQFVHPIQFGVIKDNEVALQMLHALKLYAAGSSYLSRPRIFITYPANTSENNKLVLRTLCTEIGAKHVFLISKPFASAVGVGIKAFDAKANMIIDAGAGTVDMAAVSLGGLVIANSREFAGDLINSEIVKKYGTQDYSDSSKLNYSISFDEAESIKKQIGSALPRIKSLSLTAKTPQELLEIKSEDVYDVITGFLSSLEAGIHNIFSQIPLTMVPDIVENGIYLCGGTSQMPGMESFIKNKTGIRVNMVQDPARAVINGLGSIITNFDDIVKRGRTSFLEVD